MIEVLRSRAAAALASVNRATLSTNGPAGIQAGFFPCEGDGLTLFLLVPSTSDLLFNLETEKAVVVTTSSWQIQGDAEVQSLREAPSSLQLPCLPQAYGCVLVAVRAGRIHLKWAGECGYRETIDL